MNKSQRERFFGMGVDIEVWKKDIEQAKQRQKIKNTSFISDMILNRKCKFYLTREERNQIRKMGLDAMDKYNKALQRLIAVQNLNRNRRN